MDELSAASDNEASRELTQVNLGYTTYLEEARAHYNHGDSRVGARPERTRLLCSCYAPGYWSQLSRVDHSYLCWVPACSRFHDGLERLSLVCSFAETEETLVEEGSNDHTRYSAWQLFSPGRLHLLCRNSDADYGCLSKLHL